jgi:hypothetical protein
MTTVQPAAACIAVLAALATPADAEGWVPLPMVQQATLDAGIHPGGEGCQYPQTIAIDGRDGRFLLFGTDVGGIYRSLDGGAGFSPCDQGFSANGACGFAIDPRAPDRCLAVGDNTGNAYYRYGGVYLSTDRGASWRQVLPKLNKGGEKGREQIAFDPASWDAAKGMCTIAYWAEEADEEAPGGHLYKSVDGGASWTVAAPGSAYGGGKRRVALALDPASHALYLAGDQGLAVSRDGGKSFARTLAGDLTGLATVRTRPGAVWTCTAHAVMRSDDGGASFATVAANGIGSLRRLAVSPVDPRRMLAADAAHGNRRCRSDDGGATWRPCAGDFARSWIPPAILPDDRCALAVWHPTDAVVAFGIGPGDIITRSGDGGATFAWANNGYNGIMIGGLFNFSAQDPDLLYFGSQDYNGALTTDAGRTWRFINLSVSAPDGDPWGWVYGGYSPDGRLVYGGNRAYGANAMELWVSEDGGATSHRAVERLSGVQVSCGDPRDPQVLFCWGWRSADRARSWTRMDGCDGVCIASAGPDHTLYGACGARVVRSADHGASWTTVATLPAAVRDVAYDHVHDRVFAAAADNHLYRCDAPGWAPADLQAKLPKDQHGDAFLASSVAVDPAEPQLVYAAACGSGLFFQRDNAVARSRDAGATWERLTCNPAFGPVTGGQMASAVRVHPRSRWLYVATCCYGMWKFAPPGG